MEIKEVELTCEIVKDLLPLYVDGMASDVSNKSIARHLEQCAKCRDIYQDMAFHLETETPSTEVSDVKRFLKKTKKMYFLYGLCGLSFLATLVCLIVDLAVNKALTWSLIVGSSCLFADAFLYALTACKKYKVCVAMAVISIGTFILLCAIQISTYCLMGTGTVWLFRYGMPILLLWLLALWLPALMGTFFKWNIFDCIALLLFLSILANYGTKLVTGDFTWEEALHMHGFISNALGEVVGIVLFVILGRMKK